VHERRRSLLRRADHQPRDYLYIVLFPVSQHYHALLSVTCNASALLISTQSGLACQRGSAQRGRYRELLIQSSSRHTSLHGKPLLISLSLILFTQALLAAGKMLQRLLPTLSSRVASCRLLSAQTAYSTQQSTNKIGPGPGSRSRSLDQAKAANETSTTSGPGSAPARSPDAPADPADLAHNRGSDPQEVMRSSAWQAQQAMSGR
jgi:hypothetical protein